MSEVEGKIACCKATEDDDNSWVFDSLVNFLHGPIWQLPVFGFIEEKSVVFDPDSYKNLSEENEIAYRKIHDEYKGLVDFMLGNFMEDLGVSPSQVEDACRSHQKATSTQMDSQVTKMALEQLWAAEDFQAFRRLMTRKNIDLQLQSLELLVSKYGILSPSLSSGYDETQDEDDAFLQLVISQIKEQELGEHGAGAVEQTKKPPKQTPTESVVTATIESSGQRSLDIPDLPMDVVQQKRQLTDFRKALETEDEEVNDCISEEMQTLMEEKLKVSSELGITEEMIQSRRAYMRSQRDKLVALKRKEREKLLAGQQDGDFDGSGAGSSRPKSARAAQLAMKSLSSIGNNNDNKALIARRALADRMKHELMRK